MHLHPSQEEISEISYSAKLHTIFDVLVIYGKNKGLVQMVTEFVFLVVPLITSLSLWPQETNVLVKKSKQIWVTPPHPQIYESFVMKKK